MFIQFNADGTCKQSFTLTGLTGVPEVECTFKFEGSNLVITGVRENGVPGCKPPTATYQVQEQSGNKIRLVAVEDKCLPRKRSTVGRYSRIP
jgi:hypothetical protein